MFLQKSRELNVITEKISARINRQGPKVTLGSYSSDRPYVYPKNAMSVLFFGVILRSLFALFKESSARILT